MEKSGRLDWNFIAGLVATVTIILTVQLYFGNQISDLRSEIHNDMNEFRKEMREIHGRLSCCETRLASLEVKE